jgi:hypothetical protein
MKGHASDREIARLHLDDSKLKFLTTSAQEVKRLGMDLLKVSSP